MADAAIHGHEHEDQRGFFTRWFMSTNHKDIGILYLFTAGVVGFISVAFTVYMRMELMEPGGAVHVPRGLRACSRPARVRALLGPTGTSGTCSSPRTAS